jgi:hypothetical protein
MYSPRLAPDRGAVTRAGRARTAGLAGALAATSVAVSLLLAACADPNQNSQEPGGQGAISTVGATPTTEAPPPPSYPDSAREYAEAVVAAWAGGDEDRLADLTTAQVHEQIIEIPTPIDHNWSFDECATVVPNRSCGFYNSNGDKFVLLINPDLLGKPHGAIEVALDLTEYPDNAVTYGREFVNAWRDGNTNRLNKLATDAVITYITGKTTPAAAYRACGDGAAGSTYVRIYGGGGPEYVFQVQNQALGGPEAVVGWVTPPNPPACEQLIILPTIINPTLINPTIIQP